MGDKLLQSDPSSSSDFRFDGCPVTSEEGHKRDLKSRPPNFVDYTGLIGYNTSRALADILAPLVGKTDYHVENSKHLADDFFPGLH